MMSDTVLMDEMENYEGNPQDQDIMMVRPRRQKGKRRRKRLRPDDEKVKDDRRCGPAAMFWVAKLVLWLTIVSLAAAVIWYSYELFNHG
jgi:hypothetical protein